jgi:hypothetical protein
VLNLLFGRLRRCDDGSGSIFHDEWKVVGTTSV